jgi:hypothetical protein
MLFEPIPDVASVAADRWRRLRPVARACVGVVAAVSLVLLAATDAAAADEVDSLIADTLETTEAGVDPAVEPATPIVEPLLEPIAGQLAPLVETVIRIDPIDTFVDDVLRVLEPTLPGFDLPTAAPGLPARVERDVAPSTASVAAARTTVASTPILETLPADPALNALNSAVPDVGRPMTPTLELDLEGGFDVSGPASGPPVDAGTTMVAALFIGLSMAIASGWATAPVAAWLRPMGLTLSPPVPPG